MIRRKQKRLRRLKTIQISLPSATVATLSTANEEIICRRLSLWFLCRSNFLPQQLYSRQLRRDKMSWRYLYWGAQSMTQCKEYACILTRVPSLMTALKKEWFRPFLRHQQRATNINQVGLWRPLRLAQKSQLLWVEEPQLSARRHCTAAHRQTGEPTPFLKQRAFHFYRFKDLLWKLTGP